MDHVPTIVAAVSAQNKSSLLEELVFNANLTLGFFSQIHPYKKIEKL